jgi:hypothetical protein
MLFVALLIFYKMLAPLSGLFVATKKGILIFVILAFVVNVLKASCY